MGPKVIWGLSDTLSALDKLNQGEYSKYQLCSSKIDIHMFICYFSKMLIKRLSGHPQRPQQAQARRVQQVPVMFIKMDELDEVAEGVRELLDHPVSHWDCFQLICHWKIAYKHVSCQFWMNITSTCCTRLCWACRGCWGCSRASWSPSTRMTSLWILMKY